MLSIARPVIEALVRNNFFDFVDTHWIADVAMSPEAISVQVEVVVAQAHVFTATNGVLRNGAFESFVWETHSDPTR